MLTNCHYVQYSLEDGKELNIDVEVAGVNCQGKLQYVISTVISTKTESQVALFSIGIIALIFGVAALIIGITLIGIFIWKLRHFHSNNNNLNEETLSKGSIAKQSFKSTPPHTKRLSKTDDSIKMDTLPPLPQKQQPNAPPVPSHETIDGDYDDVLYLEEETLSKSSTAKQSYQSTPPHTKRLSKTDDRDTLPPLPQKPPNAPPVPSAENIEDVYDDVLYLKEETLSKSSIAKQFFKRMPPHTKRLSKTDGTIKMNTLPPLPQKQQPNAPPVPSPENIEEVYDDVLYI